MGIGATVLVPAPTLRRTFPAYGSSPVDKTTARTLLACLFADWKGRLLYLSMYSSTYIHISDTYQTHHIGRPTLHTYRLYARLSDTYSLPTANTTNTMKHFPRASPCCLLKTTAQIPHASDVQSSPHLGVFTPPGTPRSAKHGSFSRVPQTQA